MLQQYQVVMNATEGVLLGNCDRYESAWYDSRKDAETLLENLRDYNRTARRKHDGGKIVIRGKQRTATIKPVAVFA